MDGFFLKEKPYSKPVLMALALVFSALLLFSAGQTVQAQPSTVDLSVGGPPPLPAWSWSNTRLNPALPSGPESGAGVAPPAASLQWNYSTTGWVDSSPAIADVDADGQLEVLVGTTFTA